MPEYEPEKKPEWCVNCEYCWHDDWYPCQLVCANKYGDRYDESIDKYDRCDWWTERQEDEGT